MCLLLADLTHVDPSSSYFYPAYSLICIMMHVVIISSSSSKAKKKIRISASVLPPACCNLCSEIIQTMISSRARERDRERWREGLSSKSQQRSSNSSSHPNPSPQNDRAPNPQLSCKCLLSYNTHLLLNPFPQIHTYEEHPSEKLRQTSFLKVFHYYY